jgi:gliding motility-associated-like protein
MTITAKSVDTADFKWYRFINASQTVETTPVRTDENLLESVIPVSEGGYMVVISSKAVTDTFRAWVFEDRMNIDSISYIRNCDYLQLTVHPFANRNNFSQYDYYDFCNLEQVFPRFIINSFTIDWDADEDIYAGLPNMSQAWKKSVSFRTTVPTPLKNAAYSAIITNVFGNKSDECKTKQIAAVSVYAAFDVLVPDEFGVFKSTTNFRGDALWRMRLENKSINADKFEWTGWNNQAVNFLQNDTLWTYNTEDILDEIVYKPGVYPVKLSVENTKTGCRHSTYSPNSEGKKSDIVITVENSAFSPESLPNIFTPNGDGMNDFFVFVKGQEPKSMRSMELKIVNRNGTLIYKYKGNVSDWKGWNGKINGNGSECSSGVYYYVISGDGWDDKSYSGKNYTGVLHLFRGN